MSDWCGCWLGLGIALAGFFLACGLESFGEKIALCRGVIDIFLSQAAEETDEEPTP